MAITPKKLSYCIPKVLRFLRAESFFHKPPHNLAAISKSGFQKIAANSQVTHMDAVETAVCHDHLLAIQSENFHLTQAFCIEAQHLADGIGPKDYIIFGLFIDDIV